MNQKSAIFSCLFILSLFAVFISGCADSSDEISEMADSDINKYGLNPLNKNVSLFKPNSNNIPSPPDYSYGENEDGLSTIVHIMGTPAGITPKNLANEILNQSDTVVYVTVSEILPAVQTDLIYLNTPAIYTPIVFSVDDDVKSTVSDTVTVQILGGYVENSGLIYEDGYSPTPWDFKAGDKYLLYLKNPDSDSVEDDYYYLVYRGIFVVNE